MDYNKKALEMHEQKKGKIEIKSKVKVENREDLSTAYTPGVAEPCRKIYKNIDDVYKYTAKSKIIAVVTNGTAVLGLGDIGPHASIPVMEGKAILFKEFADVDAFPVCIDSKDPEEVIRTVKNIEPMFGGINLEDIKAPECFEIEKRLKEELDIPVFHDDQHGTAVVTLAAVVNSLKIAGKKLGETECIVNGAGSAGIAVTKLLKKAGIKNVVLCDSKGIISSDRKNLNNSKKEILEITNNNNEKGTLKDGIKNKDIFIGVSVPGVVNSDMVKTMNKKPVILAMANPDPEIHPEEAYRGGALVVGTGRSDFPNQVNNVLAFPGIFKGALEVRARDINEEMKLAAAYAIAESVGDKLSKDYILPDPFDRGYVDKVIEKVKEAAVKTKTSRI
jgi:malate dehydrogenase (oxaloacetate-decarboxylating)